MSIFYLPDLGEGLPDAEVHEWYVKEGDVVKVDQPLVSMETAKAVVDVPAPQAGKILKLHGKPGDIIKTGSALVEFESVDTKKSETVSEDKGTVVGNIVVGDTTVKETAKVGGGARATSNVIKATPAVRAFAQKLGVNLVTLQGTGPNGSITLDDVQNAGSLAPHTTTLSSSPRPLAGEGGAQAPGEGFEPLRGVRRTMAIGMSKSHTEIVPVTLIDDADIYAWKPGTDITGRIIRAIIAACQKEPTLNAWFDGASMSRRIFKEVHLGMAVDSTDGLFVPVIKNADKQSAKEWREKINYFKEHIKARDIPADELKGGTITLSNFGTFAGKYANPIIVPPTVAILGTGKLRDTVVAYQGQMAIHRIMPLSLTFDHRAATGGEAARFLATVIEDLEKAE